MIQTGEFGKSKPKPRFRLVFTEGPRKGNQIDLDMPKAGEAALSFGRSRDSSVTIDSPHLSRHHAEILSDAQGRLLIRDANSVNGTILNDQPVTYDSPQFLNPGDQVRIGDTVFRFEGLLPEIAPTLLIASNDMALEQPGDELVEAYIYLTLRTGQRYLFEGEEAIIGRGQGNDIVIDSNSISRQHARLQRTPGGIYVSDLGSTNKTFVNEVRADTPVLLKDRDVVRFGDIQADFGIETQRKTGTFSLSDQTIVDTFPDMTDRELISGPKAAEFDWEGPGLDQLETALDLDVRVVGRKGRRASEALPEAPTTPRPNHLNDVRPTPARPEGYIGQVEVARLEGVYMTEEPGRRAEQKMLQDVRLGLQQGELVAVIGPSGSGKSELVQLMAGLLPADKGKVLVLGRELPTYESAGRKLNLEGDKEFVRWRARNIGYLNSSQQLDLRRSALEQVVQAMELAGLGKDSRERQERAIERLQLVGLGNSEVIRLKPGELNRTEKQRVMLARALANDPPLLLCDEPLGNLNSEAASYVFKLLQKLVANGKTVLMVTQDQVWARNASRIIEILDGVIVGSLS